MSHDDPNPLISPQSARILARVINRAAASFDVAALSAAEAMEVHLLLDQLLKALWDKHKPVLLPLYKNLLERLGLSEDDDSAGNGGESH